MVRSVAEASSLTVDLRVGSLGPWQCFLQILEMRTTLEVRLSYDMAWLCDHGSIPIRGVLGICLWTDLASH